MPTRVYNKLRPQDVLGTLIADEDEPPRNVHVCSQCKQENPKDLTFCVCCGAPLVELPAAAVLKQFHADREAQEELRTLREKMVVIEGVLQGLLKVEGFDELLKKAVKQPPE